MTTLYLPESAMVIVAHPDDIEFSCAGTMARWAQAGARICYVVITSGDVGFDDASLTRAQVVELREAEQRAAAQIAGVQEVIFLREPDGMLENTLALRKKLVRQIRRFRPEVIVTGDPTVVWAGDDYINHPDHRAAAAAALDAAFPAAGQPLLFEELAQEGFAAHKPRKVFVTAWGEGNHYVDIEASLETKIAALRAHKSQMKDWDPSAMIRQWAADAAKGRGMAFAESFRVITLVDDQTWAKRSARAE